MHVTIRLLFAVVLALLTAVPAAAQDKKFSLKTGKAEPPKDLDPSIQKLLSSDTIQFFNPEGKLVCEVWLVKELPADATAEQFKNGLTYREIKETQIIGAIRVPEPWHDYRKQPIKPNVYTMRMAYQPADGDHTGKSEFTEFLCLSTATRDKKSDLMAVKSMHEMSGKSINTGHPAVLMLFPSPKTAAPSVEAKPRDHWVVNVAMPVAAGDNRGSLGFAITLVGEADD